MVEIKSDQLYERGKEFALGCARLGSAIPKTTPNVIYFRQLIRSSASVAANYLEAQEALGGKLNELRQEANELLKIFSKAVRTSESHQFGN